MPALAAAGAAVVLVEQRAAAALAVSGWVYVLVGGTVALAGPAAGIAARRDLGAVFLGAGGAGSGDGGQG
ncbi:MAG: hypothetical protein ACM32E_11415 [Gemmatimonadota bacterium]